MPSSPPPSSASTRYPPRSTWPGPRSSSCPSSPASPGSRRRSSRFGRVCMTSSFSTAHPHLASHHQRTHRGGGADRPDPVRVLRPRGTGAAAPQRLPRPAEHQLGPQALRHRDDDVRPAHQALRAGRPGGAAVFRRPRLRRHHPEDGSALRSPRLRTADHRLRPQVQGRRGLPSARPRGCAPTAARLTHAAVRGDARSP